VSVVVALGLSFVFLLSARDMRSTAAESATVPAQSTWGITSKIHGSPEPPPPYRTERTFPKIKIEHPVLLAKAAGTNRYFVAQLEGKIYSFKNDQATTQTDLFADISKAPFKPESVASPASFGALYGLVFPPDFETNRVCYICYVVNGKGANSQIPDGSRVSRFKVSTTNPPTIDTASEEVIITWMAGGHNGGDLHFGPDGNLYISTGDGSFPNPPDALLAGQDMTNLLSSILRIDVRKSEGDRKYVIPADNPFATLAGARGEIWAYGFRNPWRMSFDPIGNGDLWAGDVGWELFESVQFVRKGGNYGWSVMEGPQPVRTEAKRGPTPILPPAVAIPHTDGASVTGGYVYRGQNFPELTGQYVYGDWETRRMWSIQWDGQQVTAKTEIVDPTVRVSAFGLDYDNEILMLDYDDGTLNRYVRNPEAGSQSKFPLKLSETGLFKSVAEHTLNPGVVNYEIAAEMWADYATSERFLAVPAGNPIKWYPAATPIPGSMFSRTLEFPTDSALVKTLSLEMEAGQPASKKRIETQVLHFNGKAWRAYTYAWNEEQTDATLVPSEGQETTLTVVDAQAPGGSREQTWTFTGRAMCIRCHNNWAETTLAFNVPQLNHALPGGTNQLEKLLAEGLLVRESPLTADGKPGPAVPPVDLKKEKHLTNPHDSSANLTLRARSYLQINCAHCHRNGGGGTADIELRFDEPMEKTKTVGVRPLQGTFGIHEGQIICSGDPYRSLLFFRMSKIGRGRMPHIGSEIVDEPGVKLIYDWIRQLPDRAEELALIQHLKELDESTVLANEKQNATAELNRLAIEAAREAKRDGPTAADRQAATARATREAAERVTLRAKERAEILTRLLSTPSNALLLSRALDGEFPAGVRAEILAAGSAHPDIALRDLFEKFLPSEKRTKRLGNVIRPEQLLAMAGDAARGKELFLTANGVSCRNCHRVTNMGSTLGPELSLIGKKLTRAQLLESILEPSKLIEPKYQTHMVETKQGKVLLGLLVEKSDKEIVLRDAGDKEVRVPVGDVEEFLPQRQSLMPELLLKDLTAQQVADLLTFLESLK